MKKFIFSLILASFGFTLVSARNYVNAAIPEEAVTSQSLQTKIGIMPPYPGGDSFNPIFGQDHAYSVTFRGNGQAVVFLRVSLSNNGEKDLKELTLRFPKVEPEGILAYQILREKQCMRYDYSVSTIPPAYQYPCLEYSEPNYLDYYYGASTYKKAKASLSTDTLVVELPDSIPSQKSGSVLLYFRAFGFAKKNAFGAYTYNFETLKVDDTIRDLRVGISPDSDLYMKGATGTVDYFKNSAPVFESSKSVAVGASFKNSSVDSALNNIGYGTVNKTANNLMPLDSYKVQGSYASSRIRLYAGELLAVIFLALLAIIVIGLIVWRLSKNYKKRSQNAGFAATGTSQHGFNFVISVLTGFISASLVTILVFLTYFFTRFMNNWSYYGDMSSILPVFGILLFAGLIGLSLVFPSVVVGTKRGIWWGLVTFILTLVWLFLVFLFLSLIVVGLKVYPSSRIVM